MKTIQIDEQMLQIAERGMQRDLEEFHQQYIERQREAEVRSQESGVRSKELEVRITEPQS